MKLIETVDYLQDATNIKRKPEPESLFEKHCLRLKESPGIDSLDATIVPSSQNTTINPNIDAETEEYEGVQKMSVQDKFKELFAKLVDIRAIAGFSVEVQEIISSEQDELSVDNPDNLDAYKQLINTKERFQFVNQLIASLEKELLELAGELLDSVPEEPEEEEEETEEEETEEESEEEETEEDLESAFEEEPEEAKESRKRPIKEEVVNTSDEFTAIRNKASEELAKMFPNIAPVNLEKMAELAVYTENKKPIKEKTNPKHITKCLQDIGDKMTDKQINAVIQSYYDENELGGSLASFKKEVLAKIKGKKESRLQESDREPVTMKDFKASLRAHNQRKKDASYNDNYNKEYKLGTLLGRNLVNQIAQSKYGMDSRNKRITMDDAINWAQSQTKVSDSLRAIWLELSNMENKQGVSVAHKRVEESKVPVVEKSESSHASKCASDIDPKTMSVKAMFDIIQAYYDDNEVGGSFASFRKEVLSIAKKK